MAGSTPVLSEANGPVKARIMLVGEAPGRLGAARSGIPFPGDEAGRRLEQLLAAAGWSRGQLFITNAVLCHPRNERGGNRPPSTAELRNCRSWLAQQIAVVDPLLVVALGAVALRSLGEIEPHRLTLHSAGDDPVPWNGRWLAAVYHPGARAAIHRPVEHQRMDFERLSRWYVAQVSDGSVGGR
jgi:uracil-DNA glycosylase family 4